MKKNKIILLGIITFFSQLIIVKAQEYIWPVIGSNMQETYIEYGYERRTYDTTAYDSKYNYEPREQKFGTLSKCSGKTTCNENHYGVDITGIKGNIYEIGSVSDGVVIATSGNRFFYAGENLRDRNQRNSTKDGGGYGNYIIIQDETTGLCFLYAHLKGGTIEVSTGERVFKGQKIAQMGSSGDSGHMHLHFEVRKNLKSTTTNFGGSLTVTTGFNKETTNPTNYIGSSAPIFQPTIEPENPIEPGYPIEPEIPTYELAKLIKIEAKDNNVYLVFDKKVEVIEAPKLEIIIGYYIKNANYIGITEDKTTLIYNINYNDFDVEASGTIYGTSYDGNVQNNGIKIETAKSEIIGILNPYKIYNVSSYEKMGDINQDGKVNSIDATIVLKLTSKINTTGYESLTQLEKEQYKNSDINQDGKVNSIDSTEILQMAARIGVGHKANNILKCDLNNDNIADVNDIYILKQEIENKNTSLTYDINQDGIVNENDIQDFKKLLIKYGMR